jgi:hypothetical protein
MKPIFFILILFFSNLLSSQKKDLKIVLEHDKYGLLSNNKYLLPAKFDSLIIKEPFIFTYQNHDYNIYNLEGKNLKSNLKKGYFLNKNLVQFIDNSNIMGVLDSIGTSTKETNDYTKIAHYNNIAYQISYNKSKVHSMYGQTKEDTITSIEQTYALPKKMKAVALMNNDLIDYIIKSSPYKILQQEYIVVQKGKRLGVWDFVKKKLILPITYKKIIPYTTYIYLKKNGLATFYPNIGTEPKYKKLDPYIGSFARFETSDGKKGWVDRKGKEYFDK